MTTGRGKVAVAMSGGVDSSVAAALVARAGFDAFGVTLKLLPRLESSFGCCGSPEDVGDAKRVCESLGLAHYVVDMAELFEERVVSSFVGEYVRGRTPNPCVECNRHVKFGYLLRLAEAWGAEKVATGHYARVEGGRLLAALDREKDQSYFLHSLTRRELARVLFPVGGLPKPEVRRLARELGLATADKPDSQEICFVPGGDYRGFLRSRGAGGASGPIKDAGGRVLGTHSGLENYTVGQRRGLGLTGSDALYVTSADASTNTLWVGPEELTRSAGLLAGAVSWTAGPPEGSVRAAARIRHRHEPAPAKVSPLPDGRARVDFDEPQRAVTPGQSVVFYAGDEVLGGGVIEEAL